MRPDKEPGLFRKLKDLNLPENPKKPAKSNFRKTKSNKYKEGEKIRNLQNN